MANLSIAESEDIVWRETITNANNVWHLNLAELWNYKDLLAVLVKRDISAIYKQTILGPLWFFIQPILTTLAYLIIFSKVAKLSTTGLPPVLFYLSGIVMWAFFSDCILKTSTFLKDNQQIFSKVYFPRLIIPLSVVLTNLVKFSIQLLLLTVCYIYYLVTTNSVTVQYSLFILPLLILMVALFGLGAGIIVASLTVKYKDLSHFITFGVQIMMFVCTVFYPLDQMGNGNYRKIIMANPMSGIIETFRYILTGKGYFDWFLIAYDILFVLLLLFIGIILFNHTEKSFVDTI